MGIMLGIKVKSAVKCHLFTPPRVPGEHAPAAEKIPRGNTAFYCHIICNRLCPFPCKEQKLEP